MSPKRPIPAWIGRREREPVGIAGSVVFPMGRSIPVTVVDIAPGGCRVDCEEPLPIGVVVHLQLGPAVANVQVRWALAAAAGLQFV